MNAFRTGSLKRVGPQKRPRVCVGEYTKTIAIRRCILHIGVDSRIIKSYGISIVRECDIWSNPILFVRYKKPIPHCRLFNHFQLKKIISIYKHFRFHVFTVPTAFSCSYPATLSNVRIPSGPPPDGFLRRRVIMHQIEREHIFRIVGIVKGGVRHG